MVASESASSVIRVNVHFLEMAETVDDANERKADGFVSGERDP